MSEVKVNKISPRTNCGTVQLGDSGDTITIPAGATIVNNGTQTGFGRTGTVDWDTTAKTAGFTAVSGTGYFVDTTSGAITMNLPATPSAGDIVSIKDYAYTFGTNNFTVDGNGSPIGGVAGIVPVTYTTNGTSKTFVYVDGTKGWLVTNESTDTSQESNDAYIVATGGTITTCGDYKIHTFTGPGTFCVSQAGAGAGPSVVDYLVVAGGAAGGGTAPFGGTNGAGGGAGGVRFFADPTNNPQGGPAAPRNAPAGITVTATAFPITVGAGGAPTTNSANPGSNSIFSSIISTGGGGGGSACSPLSPTEYGRPGGSGGGQTGGATANVGSGNTPPVSPPQGSDGGTPENATNSGGGGGFMQAGLPGPPGGPRAGGAGGGFQGFGTSGAPCGSYYYFGGGGGGAGQPTGNAMPGGIGGGGGGAGSPAPIPTASGSPGSPNTGGGGGGGTYIDCSTGGAGGSGIVIIRYKYQ
jgi:hypothetical protein